MGDFTTDLHISTKSAGFFVNQIPLTIGRHPVAKAIKGGIIR